MERNYVVTGHTTDRPVFKQGLEIYPVDLSGLIFNGCFKQLTTQGNRGIPEVEAINRACKDHVRERLELGVPLVVESMPVLIPWNGGFTDEYYVMVHLKDEPSVRYYIMNEIPHWEDRWVIDNDGNTEFKKNVMTLPHTFRTHESYLEYLFEVDNSDFHY